MLKMVQIASQIEICLFRSSFQVISNTNSHSPERPTAHTNSFIWMTGTALRGKYFYGEWASMRDGTRYWDSEAVHSLVFDYANFHVGIRAARQKVSFEELLRIAGSFAH